MRYIFLLLIFSSFCYAQIGQANSPSASHLMYSNTSGAWTIAPIGIPGPQTLNIPLQDSHLVTFTQGFQGEYFESWVSFGRPSSIPYIDPRGGGLAHLNERTLFPIPYFSGITPRTSSGVYGAKAVSWAINPAQSISATCQSWVSDPTNFAGYRLTVAIHVVR